MCITQTLLIARSLNTQARWHRTAGAGTGIVTLALLALPGCNISHPADQWRPDRASAAIEGLPAPSGFLGDYSELRPSPRHPDTLYEQSPEFASYDAFLIDPVVLLTDTTKRGIELSEQDRIELAAAVGDELRSALSPGIPVVDQAGEGVARVRAAITELAVGGIGPNGEIWLGGAAVEMEVVDSLTGKRVAAAIEADSIDPLDEGHTVEQINGFNDAGTVFRHWSQRFVRWVEAARTGEMPPTH
jgi:hypothetical protein